MLKTEKSPKLKEIQTPLREGMSVQRVWVENRQGRAKLKVILNSGINIRVVSGEHAWWFPEGDAPVLYDWKVSNINMLTSNDPPYEPTLGSVNLRDICCRLHKDEMVSSRRGHFIDGV
jgi:hypothetical protein